MKWLFVWFFIGSLATQVNAQKLVEDGINETTGKRIKRTSWETIDKKSFYGYFRISKIDNDYFFDLRIMHAGITKYSISAGNEMILGFENKEELRLVNPKAVRSCLGCGARGMLGAAALGLDVSYPLTQEQVEGMKEHSLMYMKVNFDDRYGEARFVAANIKPKHTIKINAALQLVE